MTQTAPPMPLCARDLSVTFRGGIQALKEVSLDVRREEILVVLGPSGAGKSTLLRCFNRLCAPTAGHVFFQGDDVTHAFGRPLRQLRQRVGMVFQQFNLVERLTVLENVLAGRLAHGGAFRWIGSHVRRMPRSDRAVAIDALRQVGIEEAADRRADQLSGGQQQRVAIARLIAQEPDVILADEPVASLDPRSAEIVLDLLTGIHESRGIPVVLNLHQVELARRYASRIVGLRRGMQVFEGGPEDLGDGQVRSLYEGDENRETASKEEPVP